MPIEYVEKATALHGARPLNNRNINATFLGPVRRLDGSISQAVLKDLPVKEIAKEVMAAILGRALGIEIPKPLLVAIDEKILTATKADRINGSAYFLYFGSELVGPPTLAQLCIGAAPTRVIRDLIENWLSAGHCYAFDTWIANIDRHMNNLMFDGDSEVWLIDHGLSFAGGGWPDGVSNATDTYTNRMSTWFVPELSNADKPKFANNIADLVHRANAVNVLDVANASALDTLLSNDDLINLTDFLDARLSVVCQHAAASSGVPVPGI